MVPVAARVSQPALIQNLHKTKILTDSHNSMRTLDEDVNMLLRLASGGKGVLTISQVATGEENGLTLRAYGSKGAVLWAQENPTFFEDAEAEREAALNA